MSETPWKVLQEVHYTRAQARSWVAANSQQSSAQAGSVHFSAGRKKSAICLFIFKAYIFLALLTILGQKEVGSHATKTAPNAQFLQGTQTSEQRLTCTYFPDIREKTLNSSICSIQAQFQRSSIIMMLVSLKMA